MKALGEFAFRIVCCAFISSTLNCIIQDAKLKEFIKLISALILTLTILQPIKSLDLPSMLDLGVTYQEDGIYYRDTGKIQTQKAIRQRIKEETEAYILAEAHQINADIAVTVTVGEDSLPKRVYFQGKLTPSAKTHLESFLESTLSIAKENLIWTG